MKLPFNISILFIFFFLSIQAGEKIKVACVGNSVTYGAGIENIEGRYPSQLQTLLGDNYDVQNFGHSGVTLLKKGHRPYWKTPEFEKAKSFQPDIVIIHLGLNDTDPRNWPKYRDEFSRDYISLIDTFKSANPNAKVLICKMTPIFPAHPRFKSSTHDWFWQIQQEIENIAKVANVQLIDLHSPLHNRPDLFPDALHPTQEGASIIANAVYNAVTGDYGGLQLAPVFTDNMVIQQLKPIRFFGTANANTEIKITFNGLTRKTTTANNGKWMVEFPPQKASYKKYIATVENEQTSIWLKNILVGEVWICSGQSNMAFELKDATTAQSDLSDAANPYLRFFDMKEIAATNSVAWNDSILNDINKLNYYKPAHWTQSDSISTRSFSAVGYYFGKMLQQKLNVPVGLIHNAIGGSPTEAWIDRKTMEKDPLLVNFFSDWNKSDFIDGWVRERGSLNIKNVANPLQQHPYKPSYLFESGMKPFVNFPIAGAIWYQGESNANNVELHEKLFPKMVNSWREAWGKSFPFYYVQLSSMEVGRETWGHFRDSQRRLRSVIPNSGMAVSSDVGNRTDVHPRDKKPVGERLARWALADTYNFNIVKSGPLFKNVIFAKGKAIVTFTDAKGLKTLDGKAVKSIEMAGNDKIFYPATARILGNQLEITSSKVSNPAYVRYGWQSYSEGNLVNDEGLPASTFSSEF